MLSIRIFRSILKKLLYYFAFILTAPFGAAARLCILSGREGFFHSSGTFFSLIPGKFGNSLRVAFYRQTLQNCSKNFSIGFGSFFSKGSGKIGENVTIGAYCILGNVEIKSDTRLASRCSIPSGRHQHHFACESGKRVHTKAEFKRVVIGERCWIGEGAIVMADVGDDCIVGAGSVVTHPVKNKEVVAGNPAKSIQAKKA
jgi:acetyltransferase-like isoleucine patch superfamily enzyme